MKEKQTLFVDIFEKQVFRIVNKLNLLQKKPRDHGTGDLLFPSEIHTIVAAAKNPDVHMSEIAKRLGVTRGAIMQTVVKLEKKDLLKRFMKPDSNKKVFLRLTQKGRVAFLGHLSYQKKMFKDLFSRLEGLNQTQLQQIQNVLDSVESHINRSLEDSAFVMEHDNGNHPE